MPNYHRHTQRIKDRDVIWYTAEGEEGKCYDVQVDGELVDTDKVWDQVTILQEIMGE